MRAGRAKLVQKVKTEREGRMGGEMLLSTGSAPPPHRVEPRLFPGNAPLRIKVRPAHVSAMKQFHPTPQAPLNPGVYPRNGCNWEAAFSAIMTPPIGLSPCSRTPSRRLREA